MTNSPVEIGGSPVSWQDLAQVWGEGGKSGEGAGSVLLCPAPWARSSGGDGRDPPHLVAGSTLVLCYFVRRGRFVERDVRILVTLTDRKQEATYDADVGESIVSRAA